MVVLALETVTPHGSVAVWRDSVMTACLGDRDVPHAARYPAAWLAILEAAGTSLDEVSRVAVVSGPGSFTGVRIGMASAQGLALTRGWMVTAVPTLDAMAECWRAAHSGQPGRTVIACLDGVRGDVFWREYAFDGVALAPRTEPQVGVPDELCLAPGSAVSFVGSGATRYADLWSHQSDDLADVPEPIAAGAARLAAQPAWPAVAPHALRPLYVRRPDVELARERGRPVVR
jgi:tRNA threonylcarbamoyl adenosine modification protein YeaZ